MFAARNMMFGGGAAAFSPLSLSPALWLDASDASTLYDATSGGSLVLADGTVARWEDKSGNARHATQATGASQPLRKTAVYNGRDVIRFDGVNDLIRTTSLLSSSTSKITAFCVFKALSGTGIIYEISNNYNTNYGQIASTEPGNAFFCAHRTNASYSILLETTGTTNTFKVWCIASDISLATNEINAYGNGAALIGTRALNYNNTANFTDQPFNIGARFGGGAPANIDIAEILVFPTVLSTTDRQNVERYLGAKYGISVA